MLAMCNLDIYSVVKGGKTMLSIILDMHTKMPSLLRVQYLQNSFSWEMLEILPVPNVPHVSRYLNQVLSLIQ